MNSFFYQGPPLPPAPPLGLLPAALAPSEAKPEWLNSGDNAWQLTASALVGLQSVPGLIILYGSMVKKKWAVNSAFMALYAFAAVLLCWVLWAHRMSFSGRQPARPIILALPDSVLSQAYLSAQGPALFPAATFAFFQFVFAAITVILLLGSLLGRMNFYAWMLFVPLWLTFSYTVGACAVWGGGLLQRAGLIDFAGGYVIHLSSGVAGFTAAYWVGPRLPADRQRFPPNNIILVLGGAGFLWLGWSGFNGGAAGAAAMVSSLAVFNTHLCTATSLSIWMSLDMIFYRKSSVTGAVQGVMTGLVCITPAAGLVEPWAAVLMGVMSGCVPWYTMMVLHKRLALFQKVDDTLGVFHTHAVAGSLGGLLAGLLAHPDLIRYVYGPSSPYNHGIVYSSGKPGELGDGARQLGVQLLGAAFVAAWNVAVTSAVCYGVSWLVPLRMADEDLKVGDDAVHGEEAYALWGDGGNTSAFRRSMAPKLPPFCTGTCGK